MEKKLKVYVSYTPVHYYTDRKVMGFYRICYIKRSGDEVYEIKKFYFYYRTHNKITKLLTDQKILEIIGREKEYHSVKSYRSYEETEKKILEQFKKNSMRWEIHEILYHYNR